jgi:hypothetical protein
MLSPPCEAFKGEMKRGAFPLTPCRKGRGVSLGKGDKCRNSRHRGAMH